MHAARINRAKLLERSSKKPAFLINSAGVLDISKRGKKRENFAAEEGRKKHLPQESKAIWIPSMHREEEVEGR
jgi:hypothetical protein